MTRLALDVESVLANTNEAVLQSTDRLTRDDIEHSWKFRDNHYQIYMGCSDAIWRHKPEIIPPEEPNLGEIVDEIRNHVTVDILTAREHVDENIIWWLEEHDIQYNDFISTGQPKYKYDYDIFVDDNPEMFGECRLLLRHQPWNADCLDEKSKSCDRIYSIAEVIDFV